MWLVSSLFDIVALYCCIFSKTSSPSSLTRANLTWNFAVLSCFLMNMNKGTFIPSYYWCLSWDLLNIVDRRVKNHKMSGHSQPLMSLGLTDHVVFPTSGLQITWANESALLGKPVWVGFSVLSTKSNQVEAKVLPDFINCCASDRQSNHESCNWGRGLCGKRLCEPGMSSTLLFVLHVNLDDSFSSLSPGVHLYMDIKLVYSSHGIFKLYVCYWGN